MLEEKKQLDGYEYWRSALAHRGDKEMCRPRMYEDRLEFGFYQYWSVKGGPWDAVVISPGESGPSVEINGLIESPAFIMDAHNGSETSRWLYIANHPIPYDVACARIKFGYPVIMIDDPKLAAAYYADKKDEEFLLAIKAASRKKAEIMKRPRVPGVRFYL